MLSLSLLGRQTIETDETLRRPHHPAALRSSGSAETDCFCHLGIRG